ncbi:MAG: hypothetical protein QXX99_06120 [Candidatus Bathyarchaeia archaeon]
MLERKFPEYFGFFSTETFESTSSQEILSKIVKSLQYLKLIIFLRSFIIEMERKFSDEGILPEEFIKKKLGVPFMTFWRSLENPENIIRSLIEHEEKIQPK